MPELTGTMLGRYRLLQRLGRGGMSEVYLAHDGIMNRDVALKVVSSSHMDYMERFQREAEAIGRLNHAHILPAFDYGEQEPWHYLVMPYIEYGTLRDRLNSGPLSLEETGILLEQIASALQFAHDQGIVHRDIKPSNILLRDEEYTYLADFGLAKSLEGGDTLTQQGSLLGTPEYMAPELAEGPATTSSDLYALGILLYQMVTGQVPFSGETPLAVYWKQLRDQPMPPSRLNPTVPRAIERVVMKALHKNPLRRYPTAIDLSEAYNQALTAPETIGREEGEEEEMAPVYEAPSRYANGASYASNRYHTPQEGQLVLPNSPVTAPSGVPPGRRRRFVRRSAPESDSIIRKRRFGRNPRGMSPPLEPLPMATGRDTDAGSGSAYPQMQTPPPAPPAPTAPTAPRRRRTVPVPVERPRMRRRGNPVLITAIVGISLLLLFTIPLIFIYNTSHIPDNLTATTTAANTTATASSRATQQAYASLTPAAIASAINAPLILSDDLSSNTNGRWSEDGQSCVFANGAYHVLVRQANMLQPCETSAFSFANTTFQVNVTLLAGDNAGLFFRVNGQQFYDFEITSSGQFFFRRHDATTGYTSIIGKTASSAILLNGQPNALLVIASGSDFKFFINGKLVGEQQDSTYANGHFGFVVGTLPGTPNGEASFSNLKVYRAL